MSTVTISDRHLKTLVRETVKEALAEELAKLRASFVPFVSVEEQRDIERRYGKPSRRVAKSLKIEL